jgi:CRP-like cAMP-binding protein
MKTLKDLSLIESYLKKHQIEHLFNGHSLDALSLHRFDQHEWIAFEKTDVKYLYLVLEGESRVSPSSINGKSGLLEFIMPLDVIGCLEYFSGDAYYYSVEALSTCTMLAIPVTAMSGQFVQNTNLYRYFCENMAKLMKRTSIRYSSSMLYPLKNRLAKYLYDLSMIQGATVIKLNQTQTAEYFGVTARHLRRILQEFEEEGILQRERSSIKVMDQDQLQDYIMVYF